MTVFEKLKGALKCIVDYTEEKKPANFAEAEHMLALINVIASETLKEVEMDEPGRVL